MLGRQAERKKNTEAMSFRLLGGVGVSRLSASRFPRVKVCDDVVISDFGLSNTWQL